VTPQVAAFLLELVNRQTISAGAPDVVETAQLVAEAKAELAAVLEADSDG